MGTRIDHHTGGHDLPAAVLWDMDGTLVDTEPYWFAAERDLVDELGDRDWPDEMAQQMVGFDLLDGARFLQQHGGVDLPADEIVDRLLDGVIARLHHHIPWRPGARELLAELNDAGVPCALVTMSWRRFADPVVAALPDGAFTAVVTGDEVPPGEGKPAPTPYLLGAEACGADPHECVAIEDSPTGAASAVAAGCRVIGVPNVAAIPPTPGVTLIDSLEPLRVRHLAQLVDGDDPTVLTARTKPRRINPRVVAALIAATIIALTAWWWTSVDEPSEPPLPPGAIAVDVWVPYWTLDAVADDGYERLGRAREISPFWFSVQSVDEIVVDEHASADATEAFIDEVNGDDLVPSIRDELPSGEMAAILADPDERATHIETIVAFADDYDAAGIDLDYEQFAFADGRRTWTTTRPNWVAFVEDLAVALRADGRTLTVSVPGVWTGPGDTQDGYWVYDHAAIAPHVDAIRIMAYDFSTVEPGPIAPLDWVDDVVTTLSEVVPPEYHHKLVLGVPSYGANWVSSAVGECPATASGRTNVLARNARDLAARRDGEPRYDPDTGEWSFAYTLTVEDEESTCVQNRTVRWVDAEGVGSRAMLAREAGWGGVALWALGYDSPAVWDLLVDTAHRDLTPTTTTG